MVAAFIAFIQIFSEAGISTAIIHFQDITEDALSSLFWFGLILSVVLMVLLIASSPSIARWYGRPELQGMIATISVLLPFGCLAQQLRAGAEKNLNFKTLAIIETATAAFTFFVAIGFAHLGYGAYALVYSSITNAIMLFVLSWLLLAKNWLPRPKLSLQTIKPYLKFGLYTAGNSLVNSVNMQADVLIGGRIIGVLNMGAYTLPKDLSLKVAMAINPIVTRIGLPVMAQAQHDRPLLKMIYLKSLRMTSSINFPIYVAIAFFSTEIMHVVAGPKWGNSANLLAILGIWGLFRSIGNPAGSLAFALGRSQLMFIWSICQMIVQIPIFYFGAKFGLTGLAFSILICALLLPILQWRFIINPLCEASLKEYLNQFVAPLVLSLSAGFLSYIATFWISNSITKLTFGVLLGASSYLLLSSFFNRAWWDSMKFFLGKGKK